MAKVHSTILLVDDDKFLLDMYALKFTQAGFDVHSQVSVSDALTLLRDGLQPETILFDLIMPGGDGFSFLAALQKEDLAKDARKIALTNEMDAEERKRAMDLGADEYFVKATMIPSEVVDRVSSMLAAHT